MRLFVILALSWLTIGCGGHTTVKTLFECSDKLESPYGICSHITRSGMRYDNDFCRDAINSFTELGVDYVRTDLDCSNITPINKPSCTERFDSIYTLLRNNNIYVDGLISHLQYNIKCWDDYPAYWRYIDTLVIRYGDKGGCFEILNEVDRYADKTISSKYVELLKKTYNRIKSINSHIKVLYTGVSWSKAGLLYSTMENGAFNYFDVMNFHVYNKPENLPLHFDNIKANMIRYGWNKPVWITECGYSTETDDEDSSQKEEQQAKYLPRTYLISFAYGIDKVFWYSHRSPEISLSNKEDHYGIVHSNLSPKPAFYTYKALIEMCPNNSTRPTLETENELYVSKWNRPDHTKVTALWTVGSTAVFSLHEYKKPIVYDYMGVKMNVSKSVEVSDKVVYIVTNQ